MKHLRCAVACLLIIMFICGCHAVPSDTAGISTPVPTAAPVSTPTPVLTPIKTTVPDPTPTPIPAPTQVTVLAVGDLLCLSAQLSAARKNGEYDFNPCFAQVTEIISAADLAIGNLETLVAEDYPYTGPVPMQEIMVVPEDGAAPYPTTTRAGNTKINAPESFLSAIVDCGFDVLTQANNHIYDHKSKGLIQTIQTLDEYGVLHTGAYAAQEDRQPLIVDTDGIHIAILAYTDILNDRPGKDNAYIIDTYNEAQITEDIISAKDAGADFIIVSVHWGVEHTHRPSSSQKKKAAFIANAGADLILGAHSHCTQPFARIETERGDVPVIYSMGNFISSMAKTMHKDGVIVHFVLEKEHESGTTSLVRLTYTPTLCTNTDAGRFVVLPADLASIDGSPYASALKASRQRTVGVLADTVAMPE